MKTEIKALFRRRNQVLLIKSLGIGATTRFKWGYTGEKGCTAFISLPLTVNKHHIRSCHSYIFIILLCHVAKWWTVSGHFPEFYIKWIEIHLHKKLASNEDETTGSDSKPFFWHTWTFQLTFYEKPPAVNVHVWRWSRATTWRRRISIMNSFTGVVLDCNCLSQNYNHMLLDLKSIIYFSHGTVCRLCSN